MLGVYIHIPFCSAICNYCNFNRGLYDEALKTRYVEALRQEIANAPEDVAADTIFFGGGTPSLLQSDDVGAIIQSVRERVDVAHVRRSRSKPTRRPSIAPSWNVSARPVSIV